MRTLLLTLTLLIGACGRDGYSSSSDAGVDDRLFENSDATSGLVVALAVADSFFAFDPTLAPADDAAANLMHVSDRADSVFAGCPTPTIEGNTLSVDFGDSATCTGTNGVSVQGAISIALTKEGSTLTAVVTYTDMTVNGRDLDGTLTFVTSTGSGFTISGNLSTGGKSITFSDLSVTGAPASMSINGEIAVAEDSMITNLVFDALTYSTGDCYPSGGSLTIGVGAVSQTVTFSSATPATGEVTVEVGRRTSTSTLPAYGNCPHA